MNKDWKHKKLNF